MGTQGSSPPDEPPEDSSDPHEPEPMPPHAAAAQPTPTPTPTEAASQARPARYARGRGKVTPGRPPTRPTDPIRPFIGRALPRRRRSDWGVLIFALIVSGLLLAACCAAGFAFYSTKGGFF